LRICIIGKFPPIQGGVSMRTYLAAHALGARGHDIQVVTNAKEAQPPFRMLMRAEDWKRCEPTFGAGSVTVHWSDPVDRSQSYIPMASPFVSKLATIAADVHATQPFDVIYSHYMEPYGVAGYLASQMTGVPHVVRMAGSDAGRLWRHPQLAALYDHVLRSAETIIAMGEVADRAVQRGVDPIRITPGGGYALPADSFNSQGPILDLAALQAEVEQQPEFRDMLWGNFIGDLPHFGVYGKLGDTKGSFAFLSAMHRLKRDGLNVGLVALAHGRPEIERRFRERASELGLTDRVLQIPFLPHWRVPEFLRGCLAVCCLEQDFPISFHSPIVPLEVLLCGTCLVASAEVIRKLPQWERLPHGYGCVAIRDVNDAEELSTKLAALARDPQAASALGARGRSFALERQQAFEFPGRLENILQVAAARRRLPSVSAQPESLDELQPTRFRITQMAAAALADLGREMPGLPRLADELTHAQGVLAELEKAITAGQTTLRSLALAVQVETVIAAAENECAPPDDTASDPLFRLRLRAWSMRPCDLAGLVPVRERHLRVLHFEHDISEYRNVQSPADLPVSAKPGSSHIIVFHRRAEREPVLVDNFTARILELSDGTRTNAEIVRQLDEALGKSEALDHLAWIENLFLSGLLELQSPNLR
jgi:glycosyltransferase involved in cell wall biosynthesis